MQRRAIITVGLNHSGKSTFARKLIPELDNFIIIDNDAFIRFADTQFPQLVMNAKKITPNKTYYQDRLDVPLRNAYQGRITDYALHLNMNVLIATANSRLGARRDMINGLHAQHVKIILVYMNTSLEEIYKRIDNGMPDKDESHYRGGFKGGLEKQIEIFDEPSENEGDYFISVSPDSDTQYIIEQIKNIIYM